MALFTSNLLGIYFFFQDMDSGKVVLSHIQISQLHTSLHIYIIHIIQQNIANTAPYIYFSSLLPFNIHCLFFVGHLIKQDNPSCLHLLIYIYISFYTKSIFSSITYFSICIWCMKVDMSKVLPQVFQSLQCVCSLHSLDSRLQERRRLEPGRVAWLCYGCTQASESPLGATFCTMHERATDSNSL